MTAHPLELACFYFQLQPDDPELQWKLNGKLVTVVDTQTHEGFAQYTVTAQAQTWWNSLDEERRAALRLEHALTLARRRAPANALRSPTSAAAVVPQQQQHRRHHRVAKMPRSVVRALQATQQLPALALALEGLRQDRERVVQVPAPL